MYGAVGASISVRQQRKKSLSRQSVKPLTTPAKKGKVHPHLAKTHAATQEHHARLSKRHTCAGPPPGQSRCVTFMFVFLPTCSDRKDSQFTLKQNSSPVSGVRI
ncbi:hypothetical protein E2C01_063052 [Portunus trituberculatus]|uniref:Uncharacterized protein n=1 Tax=Portunus trituberculatus TaxID=210409 RepID=A0A5B7HCP7_PORTR|nr:hypothetical protein [Portunus trituberculatus]